MLLNCNKKAAARRVSFTRRQEEGGGGGAEGRRETRDTGTIGRCLKAQPVSESSPGLIRSNADGVPERKEA